MSNRTLRQIGAWTVLSLMVLGCQSQFTTNGPCYNGIECTTGACYDGTCVQTCNEPCDHGYQCVVYGDGVWCVDPSLVSIAKRPPTSTKDTTTPKPDGYSYIDDKDTTAVDLSESKDVAADGLVPADLSADGAGTVDDDLAQDTADDGSFFGDLEPLDDALQDDVAGADGDSGASEDTTDASLETPDSDALPNADI